MPSQKTTIRRAGPAAATDVDAMINARDFGLAVESLSKQANGVIDRFAWEPGVDPQHVRGLKELMITSPGLAMQFEMAVKKGVVRRIELQDELGPGRDRVDQDGTMHLNPGGLSFARENWAQPFRSASHLAYALQRGLDAGKFQRDLDRTQRSFAKVARSGKATHDYTGPIAKYVSVHERHEARAEIARMNAMASAANAATGRPAQRLPGEKPGLGLRLWHSARDYFLSWRGKPSPDVRRDKDNYVGLSKRNIEGVARFHVDDDDGYLYDKKSSHINACGAHAVSYAAQCELYNQSHRTGARHRLRIDMGALGMSEDAVKANGINLEGYAKSINYVDKSAKLRDESQLPHTVRLWQRHHPDHAWYGRVLADLKKQGLEYPDRVYRNLAAALVVEARNKGCVRIDAVHVEDGKAFVVQAPGKPWRTIAGGSIQELARTSVESSSQRWPEAMLKYAALRPVQPERQLHQEHPAQQHVRGRGR